MRYTRVKYESKRGGSCDLSPRGGSGVDFCVAETLWGNDTRYAFFLASDHIYGKKKDKKGLSPLLLLSYSKKAAVGGERRLP